MPGVLIYLSFCSIRFTFKWDQLFLLVSVVWNLLSVCPLRNYSDKFFFYIKWWCWLKVPITAQKAMLSNGADGICSSLSQFTRRGVLWDRSNGTHKHKGFIQIGLPSGISPDDRDPSGVYWSAGGWHLVRRLSCGPCLSFVTVT